LARPTEREKTKMRKHVFRRRVPLTWRKKTKTNLEEEVDPNVCSLKLRLTGKKKVHDVILQADEPLKSILKSLPVSVNDDDEVQITCIAKRLVIKSLQDKRMNSSLRELGLTPTASIVVSVSTGAEKEAGTSTLSQRAAQKKKKGTHIKVLASFQGR
jgi:hypothetical protein